MSEKLTPVDTLQDLKRTQTLKVTQRAALKSKYPWTLTQRTIVVIAIIAASVTL